MRYVCAVLAMFLLPLVALHDNDEYRRGDKVDYHGRECRVLERFYHVSQVQWYKVIDQDGNIFEVIESDLN